MTHLNTVAFVNREIVRADLERRLDALCRDFGMDPEAVWRQPRREERWAARIAAQDELMACVRAGAQRARGIQPRGRDGRFVA